MRSWLFLLLLMVGMMSRAQAHTYHASIMDVHYNPQKKQLEVAVKVFTDDLEKALSVGQPKPVSVLEDPKPQLATLTSALLRRALVFGTKPGEILPWRYVGMERDHDAHWLYLAVPLSSAPPALYLRNHLLLDTFDDQMNIVNVEANGKKQSALFRGGEDVRKLVL
ncbi:DUF6702 family protein [Hymenobacter defluvii]|uniref:Uncharacterized protein n=1 Tax=Hymenobacter defluvii TaxID=2054411 RepID=A0ABS3TI12_9BACT|nr:DUF6702 family protein [Hymenobacter defluvii]MBO3273277.1 hypothetical protein [Hymenobacter defluvii]